MEKISAQVGDRIRYYRRIKDMTQETLAFKSDISGTFLSDVERGKKKPTVDSLEKLLKALDVTFQEFFAFENATKHKQIDGKTALDKLNQELQGCSEKEIERIYSIVKHILDFKIT